MRCTNVTPDELNVKVNLPNGESFIYSTKVVKITKPEIIMKYKNYIFDLYGTLVDIHTDEGNWEFWKKVTLYCKRYGLYYTPARMRKLYYELVKEEQKQADEIVIENVFKKMAFLQEVEVSDTVIEDICHFFRASSTKHIRLYPWTIPMLENLKKEGKKIILLSNAQRVFTAPELQKLDIEKYFDRIFISSDKGVKKPNPAFFNIMLTECGLDAKDCLMVGNDENCDIVGAHKAGMDGFYIHTKISPEYTGEGNAEYEVLDIDERRGMIDLP